MDGKPQNLQALEQKQDVDDDGVDGVSVLQVGLGDFEHLELGLLLVVLEGQLLLFCFAGHLYNSNSITRQ